MPPEESSKAFEKVFFSPDERPIAVLGQGYLTSVLNGDLSTSVLILSTHRLYQRGKIFDRQLGGRYTSTTGSRVVAVSDVTGTAYHEVNNVGILLLAAIGLVISLVCCNGGRFWFQFVPLGWFFIIMSLVIYFASRSRLFVVEYPGGAIATNARWYSQQELEAFQKAIALSKEVRTNAQTPSLHP